jgi:hypothetical protein
MTSDHPPAEAATASDRQRLRDEIDNEAIHQAWLTWVGSIPETAAGRVSRGEVFYSALDLAEYLIAPDEFTGWRISLTSEGGPYSATLILHDPWSGPREMSASDPESLTLAFLSAIDSWAKDRARVSAARYARIAQLR